MGITGLAWNLAMVMALSVGGGKAPAAPLDLNRACVTELMQLPGVGARTAQRIVAWRRTHGPFRRPEELLTIKGIGEAAFRRLRPHVRVHPALDPRKGDEGAAAGGRP